LLVVPTVRNDMLGGDGVQQEPASSGRLITSSMWNLSAYVASTLLGILSAPLYIRSLGIQQYGLMVLLSSLLLPLGLLNFGLANATIKYVAESVGRGDRGEAACYIRSTLLFNLGVGILGALILASLAGVVSTRVFKIDAADQPVAYAALYWTALGWLVSQVSATFMAVPTALQKYNIVSLGNSLNTGASIIVGLAALWLGGGLVTLVQARLGWSLVALVCWALVAARLLPGVSLRPMWHRQAFQRSLGFGLWQTLAQVGSLAANQFDRYILAAYVSTAAVGVYHIAITVQQSMYIATVRLGDVLFPAISNLQGVGQERRAIQLSLRASWLLSIFTVATLGPLLVLSHDVLRLYVGLEIANSVSWLLRAFVVAGILSSASIASGQYLLGTGNTRWTAGVAIASGVIVLLGDLLLVPLLGLQATGLVSILSIVPLRPVVHLLILRSFPHESVSGRVFFAYLYSPVVIGVVATLGLAWLYDRAAWQPALGPALAVAVACSALLVGATVTTDYYLPDGRQRRLEMITLSHQGRTLLARKWRRAYVPRSEGI